MNKLTVVLVALILMGCNKIEERKNEQFNNVSIKIQNFDPQKPLSSVGISKNNIPFNLNWAKGNGVGFQFFFEPLESNDVIEVTVEQYNTDSLFVIQILHGDKIIAFDTTNNLLSDGSKKLTIKHTFEENKLFNF